MSRPTIAEINLQALKNNVKKLRKISTSKLYPVVKANAYGHGLKQVIKTINNLVSGFCVATFEEAIELKKLTTKSVLCMEGPYDLKELNIFEKNHIDYVIHSSYQIALLKKFNKSFLSKKNKIWIKFDTGMNRLGFIESEIINAFSNILEFKKNLVLMSHFSSAASTKSSKKESKNQIKIFKKYETKIKRNKPNILLSLCNSGGLLFYKESHKDIARPGISIYGSQEGLKRNYLDLEQVMTLKSKFITIKNVSKGSRVGYDGTWKANTDSKIGILPIGYADGYSTGMSNQAYVLVDNQKAPVVGRVSMDLTAIDLTLLKKVDYDSNVVLWGPELKIDKVAKFCGTIPYELMTSVSERVRRKFIEK